MRLAGAFLLCVALTAPAAGQTPPGAKPPPKPDPVAESYKALPEAERIAIQQDLIWSGDYKGIAGAEFGDRSIAAVKAFQKRQGGKETGVLNPPERAALKAAARKKQEAVGWRLLVDGATGARLGLPAKLAPQPSAIIGGSRWASSRGEVQVETFRIAAPGTTLADAYEQQRKVAERKVSYNVLRPDFFVVSGLQGLKKVYVRGAFKDGEVRGFTILYDQAMEGIVDPVVIAMSNAFAAFPADAVAGPPPRRKVEYGSGIVVDAIGHVLTTRDLLEACQVVTLASLGPADRIADDKAANLALLRVYGAQRLSPVALAAAATKSDLALVGIGDPATQTGGGAVSVARARLAAAQGEARPVDPAPPLGFNGAAAFDAAEFLNGSAKLLGIIALKDVVKAATPQPALAGELIPAEAIRAFLQTNHVTPADPAAPADAKASVVRVICVRK